MQKIKFHKRKPLLCRLGLHFVHPTEHRVKYRIKGNMISSRSAFCKRCGVKLYLVDIYGHKKG